MDEASYLWGSYVEAQVEEAGAKSKKPEEGKRKREQKLKMLLIPPIDLEDEDEIKPVPQGRFRDPAAVLNKTK